LAVAVGVAAYHLSMTAPFDAAQGTGQRFTDALSGSDGMADPAVLMPVLDVYPDALSASMPDDLVPVIPPVIARIGGTAVPAPAPAAPLTPAQQRLAQQRAAQQRMAQQRAAQQRTADQQSAVRRPAAPRAAPQRPTAQRFAAQVPTSQGAVPPAATGHSGWQGVAASAANVAAMFRASMTGAAAQVDRESYQATHPQSTGSAAPAGVAPAAPMASQYSGRGQSRNDANDRAQQRRRQTTVTTRKSGSGWAVLVFMAVILFATGIGQRIIEAITDLLNR
jgi:hypothetical protein